MLIPPDLRRQLDSYNAENGIVELPALETGHAIKTLLFLIEAAQGETTAGGLPLEIAAPATDVGEGANSAQQASYEMEVNEQTTCEGQKLRVRMKPFKLRMVRVMICAM